jgi:hypothetical protein
MESPPRPAGSPPARSAMRLGLLLIAVSVGAALDSPVRGAAVPRLEAPTAVMFDVTGAGERTAPLTVKAERRLRDATWWGGIYPTASGERVRLYVSSTYAEDPAVAQRWADFFGGLVHGAELALLTVYIAPPGEVGELCGQGDVLGCYGNQRLVTIGDSSADVAPASVAAHEYGHHVAANRLNPPWRALDWGTKRWSTYAGVCSRVAAGTAFPGDEGIDYALNPGEGFAEAYRVLNETGGSASGFDWPIVDPSFRPDQAALAAVREDVLTPWISRTTRTIRGKFLRRNRSWTTQVATPLDGDLRLRLTALGGGADDVTLLSSDGQTVLAKASWDTSGAKSIEYRVCGARSVRVRVTRGAAPARFTLRVAVP